MNFDAEKFSGLKIVGNGEVCGPDGCLPADSSVNVDGAVNADGALTELEDANASDTTDAAPKRPVPPADTDNDKDLNG